MQHNFGGPIGDCADHAAQDGRAELSSHGQPQEMIRGKQPVLSGDCRELRSYRANSSRRQDLHRDSLPTCPARVPGVAEILDRLAHSRDSTFLGDFSQCFHHARMSVRMLVCVQMRRLDSSSSNSANLRAELTFDFLNANDPGADLGDKKWQRVWQIAACVYERGNTVLGRNALAADEHQMTANSQLF